ncbi:hypothetical protein HDU76_010997 [Blyttiomyces sp. JEL0837]|nr:hypothetical protein HDU76_010997 [Blyttiomyces sp. JEL0837]
MSIFARSRLVMSLLRADSSVPMKSLEEISREERYKLVEAIELLWRGAMLSARRIENLEADNVAIRMGALEETKRLQDTVESLSQISRKLEASQEALEKSKEEEKAAIQQQQDLIAEITALFQGLIMLNISLSEAKGSEMALRAQLNDEKLRSQEVGDRMKEEVVASNEERERLIAEINALYRGISLLNVSLCEVKASEMALRAQLKEEKSITEDLRSTLTAERESYDLKLQISNAAVEHYKTELAAAMVQLRHLMGSNDGSNDAGNSYGVEGANLKGFADVATGIDVSTSAANGSFVYDSVIVTTQERKNVNEIFVTSVSGLTPDAKDDASDGDVTISKSDLAQEAVIDSKSESNINESVAIASFSAQLVENREFNNDDVKVPSVEHLSGETVEPVLAAEIGGEVNLELNVSVGTEADRVETVGHPPNSEVKTTIATIYKDVGQEQQEVTYVLETVPRNPSDIEFANAMPATPIHQCMCNFNPVYPVNFTNTNSKPYLITALLNNPLANIDIGTQLKNTLASEVRADSASSHPEDKVIMESSIAVAVVPKTATATAGALATAFEAPEMTFRNRIRLARKGKSAPPPLLKENVRTCRSVHPRAEKTTLSVNKFKVSNLPSDQLQLYHDVVVPDPWSGNKNASITKNLKVQGTTNEIEIATASGVVMKDQNATLTTVQIYSLPEVHGSGGSRISKTPDAVEDIDMAFDHDGGQESRFPKKMDTDGADVPAGSQDSVSSKNDQMDTELTDINNGILKL